MSGTDTKPKPKAQAEWQKRYDKVVAHPCFKLWLSEHDITLEEFSRQRHTFKELRELLEWCHREWLLDKLEWMQRNGQMVNYLREHGFKASEIISLWPTEQLQAAFNELNIQSHKGNGSRSADRLGIASSPKPINGSGKRRNSSGKKAEKSARDRALRESMKGFNPQPPKHGSGQPKKGR